MFHSKLSCALRPVVEKLEVRQFLTTSTGGTEPEYTSTSAYTYDSTADSSSASTEAGAFVATDINSTPAGKTTDLGGGAVDVVAGGMRINDFVDAFHFSHQQLTGDFDVKVKISSLSATAPDTKAGLMARESLAAGSKNVFSGATPSRGYAFSSRPTTNGDTTMHAKPGSPNYSTGVWVRLKRVGNKFYSYRSGNGSTWFVNGETTVSMGSTVHVGLATSARSTTKTTTAKYRNLTGLKTGANLPTDFKGEAVTNTQINLSWTGVAGAASYRILRRIEGSFDATYITTTSTSFQDTNLVTDTRYVYQVRADGPGTPSEYTDPIVVAARAVPPGMPSGLKVDSVTTSTVALAWSPASNTTLYRIQRKGPGEAAFSDLGTSTTTSYTDTGLSAGTGYEYRVRAERNTLTSDYTAGVTATTTQEAAPATPANFSASAVSPTRVELNWSASQGATLYRIQRKGPGESDFVNFGTTASTSAADGTVEAGGAYAYRVRAERDALASDYTSSIEVTTPVAAGAFNSTDINSSGGSTQTLVDGADYNLTSAGVDIYGSADSFRFLHQQVTGDFDVMVRVTDLTRTASTKAKVGLMARDGLTGGSRNVFSGLTAGDGYRFSYRSSANGLTSNVKNSSSNFPNAYIRLRRAGNVFTSFRSSDGVAWTKMGEVNMSLPSTLHLGMSVASNVDQPPVTAQLRGFRNTPASTTTPTAQTKISWATGADAPYTTQESITLQVGSKLYMWGGYIDGNFNVTQQGWALDLDTQKWSRLADAPLTQTHTGIASDGKYIWFAGGERRTSSGRTIRSECFRYDIQNNTFSSFTALPEQRLGGALVYLNGKLHYFGGDLADRVTVSPKHWAIDVDSNGNAVGGWTRKADMPGAGDHLSAVVLNGKIIAIGGEHGHGTTYDQHSDVSEYNPATNTWRKLANLPVASSHFEGGTLVAHGRIICLGGQKDDEQLIDDVRVYDPASNSWTTITDLPTARKGGAGAFYNGKVYYTTGRGYWNGSRVNFKTTLVGTFSNPWW